MLKQCGTHLELTKNLSTHCMLNIQPDNFFGHYNLGADVTYFAYRPPVAGAKFANLLKILWLQFDYTFFAMEEFFYAFPLAIIEILVVKLALSIHNI